MVIELCPGSFRSLSPPLTHTTVESDHIMAGSSICRVPDQVREEEPGRTGKGHTEAPEHTDYLC